VKLVLRHVRPALEPHAGGVKLHWAGGVSAICRTQQSVAEASAAGCKHAGVVFVIIFRADQYDPVNMIVARGVPDSHLLFLIARDFKLGAQVRLGPTLC